MTTMDCRRITREASYAERQADRNAKAASPNPPRALVSRPRTRRQVAMLLQLELVVGDFDQTNSSQRKASENQASGSRDSLSRDSRFEFMAPGGQSSRICTARASAHDFQASVELLSGRRRCSPSRTGPSARSCSNTASRGRMCASSPFRVPCTHE